jgi:hypothetical protein
MENKVKPTPKPEDVVYDTVEDIMQIKADIRDMKATLEFLKTTVISADTTITKVAADVMPTLNSVMESPMLKMLVGKKKS